MPSKLDKALADAGAASSRHVMQTRESCQEAAEHIRASRRANARSFATLGDTLRGLPDGGDSLP